MLQSVIQSLKRLFFSLICIGAVVQPTLAVSVPPLPWTAWLKAKIWGTTVSAETELLCRALLKEAGVANVDTIPRTSA